MKKMIAMLLASVMAVGTFTTTAFAYTGDAVQENTAVSTAAQETDAVGSANAGKTDSDSSIEIDPDMQVLPDGYEVATDADGNLIVTVGDKEYNIGSEKSQKQTGTVVPGITSLHFRSGPGMDQEIIGYLHKGLFCITLTVAIPLSNISLKGGSFEFGFFQRNTTEVTARRICSCRCYNPGVTHSARTKPPK